MTISTSDIPTIYVGFDPREKTSYKVLKYSALKYASAPINIYPIKQKIMRRIGFYRRAWQLGSSSLPKAINDNDIQHRDIFDNKPFATDFSFSRFLVPFLHRLEGWALFMDCDMFFRSEMITVLTIFFIFLTKLFVNPYLSTINKSMEFSDMCSNVFFTSLLSLRFGVK